MRVTLAVAASALSFSGAVFAQSPTADHAAHHPAGTAAAAPSTMAEGEVRKVDKAQGKLTLKHGPITSLDMPGMTMVFGVSDPKMLDKLRPGDKLRFSASNVNGVLTVTALEPAN